MTRAELTALVALARRWNDQADGLDQPGEQRNGAGRIIPLVRRRIAAEALRAAARELLEALGPELERAKSQEATNQLALELEAELNRPVRCTRCGRVVVAWRAEWLNGAPFGSRCFRREALGE